MWSISSGTFPVIGLTSANPPGTAHVGLEHLFPASSIRYVRIQYDSPCAEFPSHSPESQVLIFSAFVKAPEHFDEQNLPSALRRNSSPQCAQFRTFQRDPFLTTLLLLTLAAQDLEQYTFSLFLLVTSNDASQFRHAFIDTLGTRPLPWCFDPQLRLQNLGFFVKLSHSSNIHFFMCILYHTDPLPGTAPSSPIYKIGTSL